jgi:hypothetical protein
VCEERRQGEGSVRRVAPPSLDLAERPRALGLDHANRAFELDEVLRQFPIRQVSKLVRAELVERRSKRSHVVDRIERPFSVP